MHKNRSPFSKTRAMFLQSESTLIFKKGRGDLAPPPPASCAPVSKIVRSKLKYFLPFIVTGEKLLN